MKESKKPLTIGTLAKSAHVGVETIRFYEKKGLINQPEKTSGFRHYPEDDIKKVLFVKKMQGLGFTLEEIKEFIELASTSRETNQTVEKVTKSKIAEVKAKIENLQNVLNALEELSASCGTNSESNQSCNIIECFEKDWSCCQPNHKGEIQ